MRRARALGLGLAFVAFALAGSAAADAWQYRQGLALVRAGKMNEAGAAFGRVRLLKGWVMPRLEALAAAAPEPAAAAPLLEALARLEPKAERWQAAQAMRRAALDPERLVLEGPPQWGPLPPELQAPAPAQPVPPAQLVVGSAPGPLSEWGRMVRLSLRDAQDQAHELGEGFEGPVGRSWALTPDARSVWLAQDRVLVRRDFGDGRVGQELRTEGAPQFLATAPEGPPRLLFTLAGAGGDSLMLLEGSNLRSLYPGPGAAPPTWLAAAWAPDGNSVLMWWPDAPPSALSQGPAKAPPGGAGCHVAWLRIADGHVGMEANLEAEAVALRPAWAIAKDGAVGLSVEEGFWVWDPKADDAQAVPVAGRAWGFDPSGRLVACLEGPSLLVADWRRPERQARIPLPLGGRPFVGRPAGLRWAPGKPEQLILPSLTGAAALRLALGIRSLGEAEEAARSPMAQPSASASEAEASPAEEAPALEPPPPAGGGEAPASEARSAGTLARPGVKAKASPLAAPARPWAGPRIRGSQAWAEPGGTGPLAPAKPSPP